MRGRRGGRRLRACLLLIGLAASACGARIDKEQLAAGAGAGGGPTATTVPAGGATATTAAPGAVASGEITIAPRAGELLSCGVVAGAVQVPRGGAPIVLLADHGTTGGYPVIATVIAADIGKVAQRMPGESLRFHRVERDEALDALRAERQALSVR